MLYKIKINSPHILKWHIYVETQTAIFYSGFLQNTHNYIIEHNVEELS